MDGDLITERHTPVLKTFIEYPELGSIDIICTELCLKQGAIDEGGLKITNYERDMWKNLLIYVCSYFVRSDV